MKYNRKSEWVLLKINCWGKDFFRFKKFFFLDKINLVVIKSTNLNLKMELEITLLVRLDNSLLF